MRVNLVGDSLRKDQIRKGFDVQNLKKWVFFQWKMKNSVKRTNRIFTGFKSSQDMSLKVDQCFGSIDGERESERERKRNGHTDTQ